jgi:hypothetical protein
MKNELERRGTKMVLIILSIEDQLMFGFVAPVSDATI